MSIFGPTGASSPSWQPTNQQNPIQQMQQDLEQYLQDPSNANLEKLEKALNVLGKFHPALKPEIAGISKCVNEIQQAHAAINNLQQEMQMIQQLLACNPNSPDAGNWEQDINSIKHSITELNEKISDLGHIAQKIAQQM